MALPSVSKAKATNPKAPIGVLAWARVPPAATTRLASSAQSAQLKYTSVPSGLGLRTGCDTKAPPAPGPPWAMGNAYIVKPGSGEGISAKGCDKTVS